MKKLNFILMALAANILMPVVSMAQMENPRGIYKMTRLTGNLGEVKARHLLGDEGLIAMLRRKGYTVEAVK